MQKAGTILGLVLGMTINVVLTLAPLAADRLWLKGSAWWIYGIYGALASLAKAAETLKKDESDGQA